MKLKTQWFMEDADGVLTAKSLVSSESNNGAMRLPRIVAETQGKQFKDEGLICAHGFGDFSPSKGLKTSLIMPAKEQREKTQTCILGRFLSILLKNPGKPHLLRSNFLSGNDYTHSIESWSAEQCRQHVGTTQANKG